MADENDDLGLVKGSDCERQNSPVVLGSSRCAFTLDRSDPQPGIERIRSLNKNQNIRMSRSSSREPTHDETFESAVKQIEDLRWKMRIDEYYSLLDSYTVDRWQGMPWPLSPIELALDGWKCYSPGVVRCSICHKAVVFDTFSYHNIFVSHSSTDQIMRGLLISDFLAKLAADTGHEISCTCQPLGRGFAVNLFANFNLRSFREWYVSRLESLLPCKAKLPVLSTEFYRHIGQQEALDADGARSLGDESSIVRSTAVILALHGWRLSKTRTNKEKNCLSCRECRLEVDYTKYCSLDRLSVLEENEKDNFRSSLFSAWTQPEVEFRFDCQTSHASWCPWIRPVLLSEDLKTLFGRKVSSEMTGIEATWAAYNYDDTKDRSGNTFADLLFQVDSLRARLDNTKNEIHILGAQAFLPTDRGPQ